MADLKKKVYPNEVKNLCSDTFTN